jgi:hypothetical protein
MRLELVPQPSNRAAGSAKCFIDTFQETPMVFVFAATRIYAFTAIIGTRWVRSGGGLGGCGSLQDFTRPMVGNLQKSEPMQRLQTWFTTSTASGKGIIFFVTFEPFIHATCCARAVFARRTAITCPSSADATADCNHPCADLERHGFATQLRTYLLQS